MRMARANVTTSTRFAPACRSAEAPAFPVAPVVNTSSISTIEPRIRPDAANAPRTFRRRATWSRPRCGRAGRARWRSGSTGSSQRRPSSRARASAAWCPRRRRRSRSGGTKQIASAAGLGTTSITTSAAQPASLRSPRSFQAATIRRTGSSYATAARACANASRRPVHSRQRTTGHAVGQPQRAHRGGPSRCRCLWHTSQTWDPFRAQPRQRWGSRRSSTTRR